MSNARAVTYLCPYCGSKIEAKVYDTVIADEDIDLHDRCASGDIFKISCPHCHKEFMIQYPLIYIDQSHQFVLWLNQNDAGIPLQQTTKPLIEKGYRLRRCATLSEFTEKISIFEDGVDDVMVELAKYDCFIEFVDNKKGNPEDITSIEYQRTENEVMKINVRTGDKGMAFMIPISFMEEEMSANPELYEVDNQYFPLINSTWITSLFQESAGEA